MMWNRKNTISTLNKLIKRIDNGDLTNFVIDDLWRENNWSHNFWTRLKKIYAEDDKVMQKMDYIYSKSRMGNFTRNWTEENVIETLDRIIDDFNINDDTSFYSIPDIAKKFNITQKFLMYKIPEKFSDHQEIMDKRNFILDVIESNIIHKGIDEEANSSLIQFMLRAYHQRNVEEKITTDNTHKHRGDVNINIKHPNYNKDNE